MTKMSAGSRSSLILIEDTPFAVLRLLLMRTSDCDSISDQVVNLVRTI